VSRRAPSGPPATEHGVVYTLHLDPPLGHARHYTGFGKDLEARLDAHARGEGARLTQVQLERGGTWLLASAEPGTRDREAQLKERRASRRCQICKEEAQVAEPEPEAGL
jgi:predicted GIY-YIG superfamily endonuclease